MLYLPKADPRAQEFRTWKCLFCPSRNRLIANKNIKKSCFKSSENIQKKKGWPDRSVSDNQSSSVSLNELAIKAPTKIV